MIKLTLLAAACAAGMFLSTGCSTTHCKSCTKPQATTASCSGACCSDPAKCADCCGDAAGCAKCCPKKAADSM